MAADQDYPDAVWLLGGLYSRGIGVIQDLDKADFLIHQASHLFRLNMDGLSDIITDYGNSQDQLDAILTALEHCGLTDEADILREAKALWDTDEDQYEETYSDFSERLVLFSDSDRFWDCVRAYIDANLT